MATEQFTAYTIDVSQSITNIGQLRDEIKRLRQELNATDKTEEENARTLQHLTQMQNSLKEVMTGTDKTMEEVIKSNQAATGSYNDLSKQLAVLKAEWKSTNDEAKRAEYGAKINDLNNQLKNLDASIGNYQRNVGNYEGALNNVMKGFQATAGSAKNVINPVKSVTAGFQALSATPVVAILGLIASVLAKVISNLNQSDDATKRLTEAMAPFNSVGRIMGQIVEKIGNALAGMFEWLGKVADRLGLLSEASKENQAIIRDQNDLEEQELQLRKQRAEDELRIAELRNKADGEMRNNAKERKRLLEEAVALEDGIAKREYEFAKQQWELQKRRNELTVTSMADKQKEAELYEKMVSAQTSYYNRTRRMESSLATMRTQEAKETVTANEEVIKSNYDRMATQMELMEQDIQLAERGSLQRLVLEEEFARLKHEQRLRQIEQEVQDEDLRVHALANEEAIYQQLLADIRTQYANADAEQQMMIDAELEQSAIDSANAQTQAYLDNYNREKAITEGKKKLMRESLANTAAILSALNTIMDESSNHSTFLFNSLKAVKIAEAGIATIKGSLDAYTMAQKVYPPPLGQIIGATNAAVVAATGAAQIAKIKSTTPTTAMDAASTAMTYSSKATPAFADAPVQAMAPILGDVVGSTSVLTGASGEEWLNQMTKQRVYILSSDLEANSRHVEVQAAETSF